MEDDVDDLPRQMPLAAMLILDVGIQNLSISMGKIWKS
jgi:hypothetical protein